MKHTILIIAFIANAITAFTQIRRNVFTPYANGLIYDDTSISRLKLIIDSIHLRYKNCGVNRTCYSLPQGKGFYIELDSGNVKPALKDIQRNMSLSAFVKKYPLAKVDSILIVLKERSYGGKKELKYDALPEDRSLRPIYLDADSVDVMHKTLRGFGCRAGNWVYVYYPGSKNYNAEILAFYIEAPLKTTTLPKPYAAKILYADCMMDTTTNKYLPTAQEEPQFSLKLKEFGPRFDSLKQYILDNTVDSLLNFNWTDNAVEVHIEKHLSAQPLFKKLLSAAVEEALQFTYTTTNWFEYAIEKYYSKAAALALIRNRVVHAFCGGDGLPPARDLLIAQLAAETGNLPVMMHAHLDIMNDNIINNTWYRGKRHPLTYIKELEALGSQVHDLMLAVCLSISNPPPNHFLGDVDRLGRALAHAKDRTRLEQEILSMITDNELDDHNRLRMHSLFLNYIFWLDKKEDQLAALPKLEDAAEMLPFYIYSRLKINKKEIIRAADED
jgi:hypothetical protein